MTGDNLNDRFAARMGALLGPDFPTDIALAVSGGGDSMAMLSLAHEWARHMGVRLWVVTVDHGLRPESGDEAAMVAAECAALGHPHATLRWHWDGRGNLQDAARRARLELIDRWRQGIVHVLMAHTQDDVAETFLMRLARGSGVDGLSAMAARRWVSSVGHGVHDLPLCDITQMVAPPERREPSAETRGRGYHIIRPLLTERREDLRHYVKTLHVPFVDDPSNEDLRFDRVRARQAMAEIGIDTITLAATAHRLARARSALAARAASVAQAVVQAGDDGVLRIERDGYARVERDTQLRLIAAALQWVGGAEYRPRASALEALLDRALAGGGGTLHGAKVEVTRESIEVFREFAAIDGVTVPTGRESVWDDRWVIHGAPVAGMTVRALGDDGWAQLPDLAPGALRHGIARTLPAVFDGDKLIACPALGHGPRVFSELRRSGSHFLALLNPH